MTKLGSMTKRSEPSDLSGAYSRSRPTAKKGCSDLRTSTTPTSPPRSSAGSSPAELASFPSRTYLPYPYPPGFYAKPLFFVLETRYDIDEKELRHLFESVNGILLTGGEITDVP